MSFTVDQIDLSMADPNTGLYLTANVYYVEGVTDATNALRPLSIGQLVMAICLQRAAALETQIVEMMEKMNLTSAQLEDMTKIEQAVVDEFTTNVYVHAYNLDDIPVSSTTEGAVKLLRDLGVIDSTKSRVSNNPDLADTDVSYEDFITKIEAKMDEMNSFSQQTMIELQSLTNKRDQSYDMISNILKSLNTVMTGNVNNM